MTASPRNTRRIGVAVAVLCVALAGCAGGSGLTSGPAATKSGVPTAAAVSPSIAPTLDSRLSLVALGDSIPGALGCEAPCVRYPDLLGDLWARARGQDVAVTDLATNDGLKAFGLLTRVRKDASHRVAIQNADLITIQIGFNDFQGPCSWKGAAECLARGTKNVRDALGQILDEIDSIRAGAPVLTRVVTYYDNYVGDPHAAEAWGFASTPTNVASFEALYGAALRTFNTMLCELGAAHGASCVDLVRAFNGPDGRTSAGDLLLPDRTHPSALGHRLIAETIAAAGFAP